MYASASPIDENEFRMDINIDDVSVDRSPSFGKQDDYAEKARNWKPINKSDDYRDENAWKDGGFPLNDQEAMTKFRNAFKHILKSMGRQVISGKFNLAGTSFPIWCMTPKSIL